LLVRPWYRIPERDSGDNPDIEDYLGHGDLLAVYSKGRITYSLLIRCCCAAISARRTIAAR